MEKLLHWSIANSQDDKEAIAKAGAPDPKLLQQLFGNGANATQDDPTLMKESMHIILANDVELENKLISLDNFEMLIENLDNANNIENLKLWDPLLQILDFEENELVTGALSIIGTAVQNNNPSQENFIKYEGGIRKIIKLASDISKPVDLRNKALYALSNLIRNNKDSAKIFEDESGLDIIAPILCDSSTKTKLKMRVIALLTAFVSTMEINDDLLVILRKDKVIDSVIECLENETDLNLIDRVLAFLSHLITANIKFNQSELDKLSIGFEKIQPLKERLNEDDYLTVKYVLN